MTVREYIIRKNEIVKKATGHRLVRRDQIIDLEPMPLCVTSDTYACPYCVTFFHNDCEGCPITDRCSPKGSGYEDVIRAIDYGSICNISGVRELITEYNESNGFMK